MIQGLHKLAILKLANSHSRTMAGKTMLGWRVPPPRMPAMRSGSSCWPPDCASTREMATFWLGCGSARVCCACRAACCCAVRRSRAPVTHARTRRHWAPLHVLVTEPRYFMIKAAFAVSLLLPSFMHVSYHPKCTDCAVPGAGAFHNCKPMYNHQKTL